MGGRAGHSVGGKEDEPGLPVTGWSRTHGDLRVTHFLSLHALQILPLAAALIGLLPVSEMVQVALLALVIGANATLTLWTWRQALAGRPLLASRQQRVHFKGHD